MHPTCHSHFLNASETVRECPLPVGVTSVVDALFLNLSRSFARKYVLPSRIHSFQCESVRCVSKQGCRYEAECNVEWESIVWSVLVLVKLATDDSSKIAEAVSAED